MNQKIINKLFRLADKALAEDEFPVAAIIYEGDKIISGAYNKRNSSNITTDHAEIMAIRKANKKCKSWRLTNKCMVVTLEPCDMCKSVIKESRLEKVYYLVPRFDYKKQYKRSCIEQYNVDDEELNEYKKKIQSFFKSKRGK